MEKIFEQALLYDFYGELLTPHQRTIYEDVVFNDMSLGEIAKEQGISRQGVHDLVKRCDKILQDYESKLHLVEKFSGAKKKIGEIVELTCEEAEGDFADTTGGAGAVLEQVSRAVGGKDSFNNRMQRIRELSLELMEEW